MNSATDGEDFVAKLTREVRDPTIRFIKRLQAGEMRGAIGDTWSSADAGERAQIAACYAVDQAIAQLLTAIDNGNLDLRWVRDDDGEAVALSESCLGELTGEYVTIDGWREKYTNQPFYPFI